MGPLPVLAPLLLAGCASPGPPRPPSLFVPRPVADLQATRSGDTVQLRFTVPALSTDGQPLRARTLTGVLCRQDGVGSPCRPVPPNELSPPATQPLPVPGHGPSAPVLWTDTLPAPFTHGKPRPIAYRMELRTPSGGTAGFSDPVYTAAGTAPPPVTNLTAEGTRLGIALRWTPVAGAGEVVLRRVGGNAAQQSAAPPAAPGPIAPPRARSHDRPIHSQHPPSGSGAATGPGPVWLQAAPGADAAAATVDNGIEPGVTYRYTAVRRVHVQAGGRTLELEGGPSAEVESTWRDIYPPPAPTELTALGYLVPAATAAQSPGYAVDLVWLPAEDAQLAGYLVYRQALGGNNQPETRPDDHPAGRIQLTPEPLETPGFHDATAAPGQRYRYTVTAIAANGRQSDPAETVLQPQSLP